MSATTYFDKICNNHAVKTIENGPASSYIDRQQDLACANRHARPVLA